ncbi:MAG: HAMP domain-containing histidine kinase [Anaerolineales bacterium]|nr:HAMP domain-containing histidine kinase [Anaerolineales bacterium]
MRSLTVKLTLAFLLVGLTGAVLVAIIVQQRTRLAFDQYAFNKDQETLVENLLQYYQTNGRWEGIEMSGPGLFSFQPTPVPPFEGDKEFHREWPRFTLADAQGIVLSGGFPYQIGSQVPAEDLEHATPLEIDDSLVGWLVIPQTRREWGPDSPEGMFLHTVNNASLISALIAAAMALSLGGLLAYSMTRSLRELKEATLDIARGRLGRQVKVRTKDEIGDLVGSFNKMSLDLAHATQARRQMTADIAHDLRSPLSVLIGYTEAINDGKLPGTPEVFSVLYQETKHLSLLVDDLRTLSLADAGELQLNLLPCEAKSLLERVATRHAVAAQQKNITLRVEADQPIPAMMVDAERMAQVLDNLILNAFRYISPGGEIVLIAEEKDGKAQLQVKDNGSGIAPEDLPYIFDRLYRGDKSRQQNGASGLGLAIAKSIVETQGGTITGESTLGQGTTFTITLPAVSG